MQADAYLGIDKSYSSVYKQGGSKFFGFLFPISSIEDFKSRISSIREIYSDATHVCSAVVLEKDSSHRWFTDDGEPSNSSGRPILNALLGAKLTYIGCAVVRYYGGKKLGVPGLIESYGGAAQMCIDSANIKELEVREKVKCSITAAKSYLLYNYLNKNAALTYEVTDSQFVISCLQSFTGTLRSDLLNIESLKLNDD